MQTQFRYVLIFLIFLYFMYVLFEWIHFFLTCLNRNVELMKYEMSFNLQISPSYQVENALTCFPAIST